MSNRNLHKNTVCKGNNITEGNIELPLKGIENHKMSVIEDGILLLAHMDRWDTYMHILNI